MASAAHPLTPKKRALFLAELAKSGNVSHSAEVAGYARRTVYDYREQDPIFAAAWEEALERAADVLEHEARRRAVDGVEKYVTTAKGLIFDHEGNPLMERTFSDTLLIFLLKGVRPDKYRDNAKVEHSGAVGLTVRYENDWRGGGEDEGAGVSIVLSARDGDDE